MFSFTLWSADGAISLNISLIQLNDSSRVVGQYVTTILIPNQYINVVAKQATLLLSCDNYCYHSSASFCVKKTNTNNCQELYIYSIVPKIPTH